MFDKVLIANRGEIALRVIRACKELGIKTVAVYSEADKNSLHVRYADESYLIGPAMATESYLSIDRIIDAAEKSHADAVHPGYGFLSENPEFAEACRKHRFTFIGPSPEATRALGSKINARKLMNELWVPVVPGWNKNIADADEAVRIAKDIGYPVILKAAAGGGGRGMRVVNNETEMRKSFDIARAESQAAFNSPVIYLERYVEKPRHIEFQFIVDEHGNAVHLGERECSLQRKHQKVLEEAPSVILTPDKREIIGEVAADAALSAGYTNAGTMEFIMDKNQQMYFLEVNSRIQVEHPVTELVTGVDLIKAQLAVAAGEKLPFEQKDITMRGHAIECRINAEDPFNNFCPCPGKITNCTLPSGPWIRTDTVIYPGYTIPQYYDSMIAKVVSWGRDRTESIARMNNALNEFTLGGITSTIPYHKLILSDEEFIKGNIHTKFIEEQISTKEVYKKLQSPEFASTYSFEEEVDVAIVASALSHYLRTRNAQ